MADYKQQEWISGHGTLGGKRSYLRKNVSLEHADKTQFPHVVIVNLVYRQVREDGLPAAEEELSRLDATEESVADQMQAAFGALFGLIVTSDGTRDLFFLLREPESDDAMEAVILETGVDGHKEAQKAQKEQIADRAVITRRVNRSATARVGIRDLFCVSCASLRPSPSSYLGLKRFKQNRGRVLWPEGPTEFRPLRCFEWVTQR